MAISKASKVFFLLGSAIGAPLNDATVLLQSVPEASLLQADPMDTREAREHRQRKELEGELFQESMRMEALKEQQLKHQEAVKEAHEKFREEQKLRDAEALAIRKRTIQKLQEQQDKENEWRATQASIAEQRVELKAKNDLVAKATKVREDAELAAASLTNLTGSLPDHLLPGKSMVDVIETLNSATKALKDAKFLGRVAQLADEWENQIAALAVGSQESVAKFVSESSPQVVRADLSKTLLHFVERSEALITNYQTGAASFAKEISRMRGSKDIVSLFAPVAQIEVAPMRTGAAPTDPTMDDACSKAAALVSSLSPVYKNLTRMHTDMASTAKLTPIFNKLVPNSPKDLEILSRTLINVGLMDAIAIQDTARDIISKVGPVVLTKYKCTWSAASPRTILTFGFVAMLVSMMTTVEFF